MSTIRIKVIHQKTKIILIVYDIGQLTQQLRQIMLEDLITARGKYTFSRSLFIQIKYM